MEEALTWPSGPNIDHKESTLVFEKGRYSVRLSKPGKEAAPGYARAKYKDGTRGRNPNDMRPEITVDGKLMEKNASFLNVFDELYKLHNNSPEGVELMGYLLARSAFMADHKELSPGIWRYDPPEEIIERLAQLVPEIYGVPVEVFLHYLNALALNEDTKYRTLGYDIRTGVGRRNNMLTCVNLIGVLLDRISIVAFAGDFSRPPAGIAAISITKMREILPALN